MKRSSRVSLVLLSSVGAAVTLSGCEAPPATPADTGGTFANKAECIAVYDQATCDAADKLAKQEHLANAPKFSKREECIAQFGAEMCQPASNYGGSSDIFMPMMMGYMMGSAMSNPAPLYYGPGSYRERERRGASYQAPIYTSGQGYSRSQPIGSAPYKAPTATASTTTKGSLKSSTAMTPPSSVRGGFGDSFKPTNSFKTSTVATTGSSAASRSAISSTSNSSFKASGSVSSRGGFGSSARGFGGGGA